MRALVVAGSKISGGLDPVELARADLLMAVDAGADTLFSAGLEPSLLLGDMDSITPRALEHFQVRGAEMILLPTAKDETDLEAALHLLVDRGVDDIVVYGALGGPRLDHLLANVLLLTSRRLMGASIRLADNRHQMFLVRGDAEVAGKPGNVVSLLPLTAYVQDVYTEGLAYPLAGETLVRSSTRSVSNEMTGGTARVTHGEGVLLLVHYRGR